MKRRDFFSVTATSLFLPSAAQGAPQNREQTNFPPQKQQIAGEFTLHGNMEIIARFTGAGPSGIAVNQENRIFVSFPRHAISHDQTTLGELKNGKIIPFPNPQMNMLSHLPPEKRLLSVHGITMDDQDRLWVIDDGKIAGQPIPAGGAKIVGFDTRTGNIISSIVLKPPALLPDSHMNDLRVDLTHGKAGVVFIADSSFGTLPALVVVDIASGRQRRVLKNHFSTQPEKGFLANLDGELKQYDPNHPTCPIGGIDGIALSKDSAVLYYAPLTSRKLYSIQTAPLADFSINDDKLAHYVIDEGEKGMCDGMAIDKENRLYITGVEHHSIFRRNPDGSMEVILRNPKIIWPDGIFATMNANKNYVYCTLGQWNRLPGFNNGKDLRVPPYLLIRTAID